MVVIVAERGWGGDPGPGSRTGRGGESACLAIVLIDLSTLGLEKLPPDP